MSVVLFVIVALPLLVSISEHFSYVLYVCYSQALRFLKLIHLWQYFFCF